MAEIKIEKKKPLWPWILLLLILAAVVIFYFMNRNEVDDMVADDDIENIDDVDDMDDLNAAGNDDLTGSDALEYGEAFSRQESDRILTDYKSSIYDSTKIGTDLSHTKMTMIQLVKAVEIKANQFNVDVKQSLDSLNNINSSQENTTNSDSQYSSKELKSQAKSISSILQKIQQEKFPNLKDELMELDRSVANIKENVNLDAQGSELNKFFNEAAVLLNSMN